MLTEEKKSQYLKLLKEENLVDLNSSTFGIGKDIYARIVSVPIMVDKKPNTDYYGKYYLTDPINEDKGNISSNIFRWEKHDLEQISVGDIVFFRRAIVNKGKHVQVVCTSSTEMIIFCGANGTIKPTKAKHTGCNQRIINFLTDWSKNNPIKPTALMNSQVSSSRDFRKLLTTAEILNGTGADKYFNYVGVVMYCTPNKNNPRNPKSDKTNMVLTDYTINPQCYKNRFDSPIEVEYMIECGLWGAHSRRCPDLQRGDYVYLNNCKQKLYNGVLEFNIHETDSDRDTDKNVMKLDEKDPLLRDLLKRKAKYESVRSTTGQSPPPPEFTAPKFTTNVSVRYKDMSIKEIHCAEEISAFRSRSFISEYKPHRIKDWVCGWCKVCRKTSDPHSGLCDTCQKPIPLSFKFCFILDDYEKEYSLLAYGYGDNAINFLADFPAADVLNNPEVEQKLKDVMDKLAFRSNNQEIYCYWGLHPYDTLDGRRNYTIINTRLTVYD